jgi:hypothetical protein
MHQVGFALKAQMRPKFATCDVPITSQRVAVGGVRWTMPLASQYFELGADIPLRHEQAITLSKS